MKYLVKLIKPVEIPDLKSEHFKAGFGWIKDNTYLYLVMGNNLNLLRFETNCSTMGKNNIFLKNYIYSWQDIWPYQDNLEESLKIRKDDVTEIRKYGYYSVACYDCLQEI